MLVTCLAFVIALAAGGTGTTRSRQCAMQLSFFVVIFFGAEVFFSTKNNPTTALFERFLKYSMHP